MIQRGVEGDGLSAIGIGAQFVFEGMINSQIIGDARFKCVTKPDFLVTITRGNALFVDFEPIINGEVVKIEFKCNPGTSCRLLNKLAVYEVIKNFYNDVLDNCLGKTCEEQNGYLFRYNQPGSKRNYYSNNLPEHINSSEDYIRSLPDEPTDKQFGDLAEQVIYGKKGISGGLEYGCHLEYGFHAKDEFNIEMNVYAKAIFPNSIENLSLKNRI